MGLAASQARLLFITARQNDVSANMQRLSNQLIVFTRDKDEIAATYNGMVAGTIAKSNVVSNGGNTRLLSYSALMGDTAAKNGSKAMVITDKSNRVVLTSDIASKLGLSGGSGKVAEIARKGRAAFAAAMGASKDVVNYLNNGKVNTTDSTSSTNGGKVNTTDSTSSTNGGKVNTTDSTSSTAGASGNATAIMNQAMYYINLFEKITTKYAEWTVDSEIGSNPQLFTQKLENRTYLLDGKAVNNAVSTQGEKYTSEEAKNWYDIEMGKIKTKEDKIDIEMSKLQTEYTGLTNDYNSVKSIIDASVQRAFTYCQNG